MAVTLENNLKGNNLWVSLLVCSKKGILSGIHLLHEELVDLSGLIVAKSHKLLILDHRPVAFVVFEVKVTGIDVRPAEGRASKIPVVIDIREHISLEFIYAGGAQVDGHVGAFDDIGSDSAVCHDLLI